jgi:dUTP pyrophosphatase
MQTLKAKKLNPNAKLPTKANKTDAGFDLYALNDAVVFSLFSVAWSFATIILYNWSQQWFGWFGYKYDIRNKELAAISILAEKIPTGIALEIPTGYCGVIHDRSSMGSLLLKTLGGVIDSEYRGDVKVCMMNLSFFDYHIKAGDKIAQILFHKVEFNTIEESEELTSSDRGEKGFGSSGK